MHLLAISKYNWFWVIHLCSDGERWRPLRSHYLPFLFVLTFIWIKWIHFLVPGCVVPSSLCCIFEPHFQRCWVIFLLWNDFDFYSSGIARYSSVSIHLSMLKPMKSCSNGFLMNIQPFITTTCDNKLPCSWCLTIYIYVGCMMTVFSGVKYSLSVKSTWTYCTCRFAYK